MPVAKTLILLALLAATLVGALRLGRAAGALATRLGMPRHFAAAVRVGLSVVLGFLGTVVPIVTLGAVANADAASKATLLARRMSEALACAPLALPLAAAVVFATALWTVRRWNRRPPDPDRRA